MPVENASNLSPHDNACSHTMLRPRDSCHCEGSAAAVLHFLRCTCGLVLWPRVYASGPDWLCGLSSWRHVKKQSSQVACKECVSSRCAPNATSSLATPLASTPQIMSLHSATGAPVRTNLAVTVARGSTKNLPVSLKPSAFVELHQSGSMLDHRSRPGSVSTPSAT
jgi:hypothetical protein